MMMKNKEGFSIVECLMYITLFSFLVSSLVLCLFYLKTGAEKTNDKILQSAQVDFLFKRIERSIEESDFLHKPTDDQNSHELVLESGGVIIRIFLEKGNIKKEKAGEIMILNDENFPISSFEVSLIRKNIFSIINLKVDALNSVYERRYVYKK